MFIAYPHAHLRLRWNQCSQNLMGPIFSILELDYSVSLTDNVLHTSQLSYIPQLFTIQPSWSNRSSSYLSLSWPLVLSSLKFCNHSLVYAEPALWKRCKQTIFSSSYHVL